MPPPALRLCSTGGWRPTYINQGGQDIVFSGRRDFDLDEHTRAVATGEYLSSYVYREAFAESFALAVASQVTSSAFITHNDDGLSASIHFDRYQNFEGSPRWATPTTPRRSAFSTCPASISTPFERRLEDTPLRWSFDGSAAGLSRSEPGFATGEVGRFDLYPHLALPLHLDGWTLRPEVGARETFYTQSQISSQHDTAPGQRYRQSHPIWRPALSCGRRHWFGISRRRRWNGFSAAICATPSSLRCSIASLAGVNNFSSIPRFDRVDIVSDTNEVEYSLTQRLFFKHLHPKPCSSGALPAPINGIINVPLGLHRMRRRYQRVDHLEAGRKILLRPVFRGRRVSFAAQRADLDPRPHRRGLSERAAQHFPLISRFKVRTSEHMDLEWDADYDFKTHRMDASNVFANYRRDSVFASVGYSTLQALNGSFTSNLASQVTKYNLLRLLLGYGAPTKRGLSAAANAGYDFTQNALQYGGIETSYNWDCCGLVIEYRRLALGSVRNENQYSFSFTLAGVGAAGNLTHSERIF